MYFLYRLQKKAKAAADVEYPAYGITGIEILHLFPHIIHTHFRFHQMCKILI